VFGEIHLKLKTNAFQVHKYDLPSPLSDSHFGRIKPAQWLKKTSGAQIPECRNSVHWFYFAKVVPNWGIV